MDLLVYSCGWVLVATWVVARDLIKIGQSIESFAWAAQLGAMVQVSIIGYAAAGAFLSLAYYDLPYNVMIMAIVARRYLQSEQRKYEVTHAYTASSVDLGQAR